MQVIKITISILVLFIFSEVSISQENWWEKEADEKEGVNSETKAYGDNDGKVTINSDPRLDKLVEFLGEAIPPAFEPQMDGFRVQLFFDQERTETNDARGKFIKLFNDIPTYIEYKAPNYFLTVGNFRDRLSAERLRAKILDEFPEAIIVETRVYLPKLD